MSTLWYVDKGLGGKFLLCEHCGMWTKGWVVSSCYMNIVVCEQWVGGKFLLCEHCGIWTRGWVVSSCYVNTVVCGQGIRW